MKRILVTGAAGSGTSTLAAALAADLGGVAIEADDHLWQPTTPPYQHQRDRADRLAGVLAALKAVDGGRVAALAGSVMGWGDALESAFDLIVFLQVDTAVRLERLRARETRRFGRVDPAFLDWAASYDAGPPHGRSLARHRAWLDARTCPVLALVGVMDVEYQVAKVRGQGGPGAVDGRDSAS